MVTQLFQLIFSKYIKGRKSIKRISIFSICSLFIQAKKSWQTSSSVNIIRFVLVGFKIHPVSRQCAGVYFLPSNNSVLSYAHVFTEMKLLHYFQIEFSCL